MKQLIAAVDFSTSTETVLEQAAQLAKAFEAKLWVLHVASTETMTLTYDVSQFSGYAPEYMALPGDVHMARNLSAEEIKREHAQLQGISSSLRDKGINAQAALLKGDAASTIVDKANDLRADMIILGSHGHGLLRKALLGSVSEAVIQKADRNVLIVPVSAT